MDFVRIVNLCEKYNIINNDFAQKTHRVRKLRNRLHIGGLTNIEKDYTKRDLNLVFNIAKDIKKIVSK